ncbi:MAG TPA: single-stranded-DNA-specific exonuclease RecJ [Solirubrobacteraceae bacterium]
MAEPALLPQPDPGPDGRRDSRPSLRVLDTQPTAAPKPRLEIPPYDFPAAQNLERELGIGHVLAQILVRRGLSDPEQARAFLEAEDEHPPSDFHGIDAALDQIHRHIHAGSRITVHGDYDVDGVCATAVLVRALRALGGNADWFIPSRTEDGYGLSAETVNRLHARGTRLIITADCAITAVEEVAAATAAGIDVVVTDHHHPRADGTLPDAPIVHPAVCGYPCAGLCGTGVAYKLAQALGAPTADEDLELVALATVADLMPLKGENRRLVRAGLAQLARTANPGLRALMEVSSADPSALDAQVLGFRLAPRINAAGRLRRADAALELLLTQDPARAAEIAHELDQLNAERRAVEQRITWEAEAQVAELGDRPAFVLAGEGWHQGVVGIVASRIVERHHRPTVVLALDGEGEAHGSARSIPGFDLLAALHACAPELERYGGHRAAAGMTVRPERIESLRDALERHAASVLTAEMLEPVERVDAIVSGSELGLGLADELDRLEPTGMGNPRPRLLVPGARLGELRAMGEGGRHARFVVSAGGTRTPAVAFGCDGRLPVADAQPADATFRLERNAWNGTVEPRLVLREAWGCVPEEIVVLGEPERYLDGVIEEVDRDLGEPAATAPDQTVRTVIDRRGESPLAVLADALASGSEVLAVCADVARRVDGLGARIGGFCLISHHALERAPQIAARFAHVVVLDPPAGERQAAALRAGSGFTHVGWGDAELRFAKQMHELEYGLRVSLVAFYRDLRSRRGVAGEELERLLRGERSQGRPARLAGRLIRVLAELELVSLDRDLPALAVAGTTRTELDRSQAFRAYTKRHEDGRRFLSSANPMASSRARQL